MGSVHAGGVASVNQLLPFQFQIAWALIELEGVGVGEADCVAGAVGVGIGIEVGEFLTLGTTTHINFLPDFLQMYSIPFDD